MAQNTEIAEVNQREKERTSITEGRDVRADVYRMRCTRQVDHADMTLD